MCRVRGPIVRPNRSKDGSGEQAREHLLGPPGRGRGDLRGRVSPESISPVPRGRRTGRGLDGLRVAQDVDDEQDDAHA